MVNPRHKKPLLGFLTLLLVASPILTHAKQRLRDTTSSSEYHIMMPDRTNDYRLVLAPINRAVPLIDYTHAYEETVSHPKPKRGLSFHQMVIRVKRKY